MRWRGSRAAWSAATSATAVHICTARDNLGTIRATTESDGCCAREGAFISVGCVCVRARTRVCVRVCVHMCDGTRPRFSSSSRSASPIALEGLHTAALWTTWCNTVSTPCFCNTRRSGRAIAGSIRTATAQQVRHRIAHWPGGLLLWCTAVQRVATTRFPCSLPRPTERKRAQPEAERVGRSLGRQRVDRDDALLLLIEVSEPAVH